MYNNRITLLGRVTRDIELKEVGENKIVNFTVAVDRIKKGDDHPEADFIPCVAFNKTAEIMAKYVLKGDRVGVAGHLQSRSYEDKEGNRRTVYEVVVEDFAFIESAKSRTANTDDTPAVNKADKKFVPVEDDDDDLPF